jgi:hypothetical protein
MKLAAAIERLERVESCRANDDALPADLISALRAWAELTSFLASAEADLTRRLAASTSFPEAAIAETTRGSLGDAGRTLDRSNTLAAVPLMAHALDNAVVTPGHIDAVTRGAKGLEPAQRQQLFDKADSLVDVAAHATVEQFGRRIRAEINRIIADDGMARLDRQRRATTLTTWTDAEGMWNLRAKFDPVTALTLSSRLDNAVETMFAEATPPTCPTDPIEKQRHLRALALARLISGEAAQTARGRPEFVAVINVDVTPAATASSHDRQTVPTQVGGTEDGAVGRARVNDAQRARPLSAPIGNTDHRAPRQAHIGGTNYGAGRQNHIGGTNDGAGRQDHIGGTNDGAGRQDRIGGADQSVLTSAQVHSTNDADKLDGRDATKLRVDWPIPIEVPAQVLAEMLHDADISVVVVRNGVVLHAPGNLNLERSTRLASRAQRRALRGLYSECAMPNCNIAYDRCKLHHIRWWRHGGMTNLDNLVPVCSEHHHRIHDDGWLIDLDFERRLTLTLPDGTVRSTGPPRRAAA